MAKAVDELAMAQNDIIESEHALVGETPEEDTLTLMDIIHTYE